MNTPTHRTHTIEQLRAALREAYDEHRAYAREHGAFVKNPPPNTVAYKHNWNRELRELNQTIDLLAYEITCAETLARLPFTIGQRVRVLPPFIGRDSVGHEMFGVDYVTHLTGTVIGMSPDDDLLLDFEPTLRDHQWVYYKRCVAE